MDWSTIGKEFGLLGIALMSIASALFLILKWVLEQFKEELVNNRKERTDYLVTLQNIRNDLCEHNERAKENHASTQAEHREMIVTLGRINGYRT